MISKANYKIVLYSLFKYRAKNIKFVWGQLYSSKIRLILMIKLTNFITFLLKTGVSIGLFLSIIASSHADEDKQNLQEIKEIVKQFLIKETAGISSTNKITVEAGSVDSRLNLTKCALPEAFMPAGSRLWGKTSVGVRCLAPDRWTIYVPGAVKIWGNYYTTAKPITRGQTISQADLSATNGDLTSLPSGIVTEASQAVGRTSINTLAAGIPLRQDGLRLQQVVLQGQTIRLISHGSGFKVSTEGQALNNASEGQLAKVKINSGQVISGIAKYGGVVEIIN